MFLASSHTCVIQSISQTITATALDAQLEVFLQWYRMLSYCPVDFRQRSGETGDIMTLCRLASSCLIRSVAASVSVTGDLSKRKREPPRLPSFDASNASEACTMSRQEHLHKVHWDACVTFAKFLGQ